MRAFREIVSDEGKERIDADLADWGYPREVEGFEWGQSVWVRWGQDVIFWYNLASEPPEPRVLALHICVKPESRSTLGSARRLFLGWEVIAEILDAERICAIVSDAEAKVRDYLQRLGWTENERGWMVKDLGG